jgi:hypothetical protein
MCTFIGCTFICMMVLKVMASMGQSSDEPFKKPPPVPWPKGKPPPPFKKAPPLPWPNYPNGKPPPPLIDEHREKATPVLPKQYMDSHNPYPLGMGSYGDTWLRCTWCAKWGKCPCFVILDRDIDGTGTLCDPCYYRGCPPHYEYLGKLLAARLTAAPEVLEAIAAFAYPICNGIHFATCRCPACR